MNKLPQSRNENILVQNLEKEVLVYDLLLNKAYCLNETCAKVFNACDGEQTFDNLKQTHQFTDDLIFLALDELKSKNLLADANSYQSTLAGMTRREAARKVGFATLSALPVISSLIAPAAVDAASSCVQPGGTCIFQQGAAQSNCCTGQRCFANQTCNPCATSGEIYSAFTPQEGGLTACRADPSVARCCNTNSNAVTYDGGTISNACRCG